MKKIERIILEVESKDVINALVKENSIPEDFEIVEFTYSLSKITDKNVLAHMVQLMDTTEYKVTHCRIVLEKKGGS